MSRRRWVRAVLAIGTLAGVINAVGLASGQPAQIGIATDVYHHAGSAILAGENPYLGTPADHPGFHYLYPPIVLLAVVPYGLLGEQLLVYGAHTGVNLLTAVALALAVIRTIEEAGVELDPRDRWLLGAYTVGWFPTASSLVMGQVNLQLALGIALATRHLERHRRSLGATNTPTLRERISRWVPRWHVGTGRPQAVAGVLFALVALVKLFPALVGFWLLRLREWRSIGAAVLTGIGGIVLGFVIFGPGLTEHYLTVTLQRELSVATFASGPAPSSPYMTVRRQFSVLFPDLPQSWLLPAALAVLAPIVLASYRRIDTLERRLLALHATLLGTLIAFPLEPFYLGLTVFPMVPLLYLFGDGSGRRLYLIGALIVSVPIWFGDVSLYLGMAPEVIAAPLLDLARDVYSFVLPMMIGVWAMLAGIVIRQWWGPDGA